MDVKVCYFHSGCKNMKDGFNSKVSAGAEQLLSNLRN